MTALTALVFALLPAAFAQTMHSVQVGPNGTLTYDPPFITAAAGDTVKFTFNPKNHTVTQSSFAAPCVPLAGGATSGFHFESNVTALLDTWEFTVADSTTPSWFFCEQTGHCGQGMVFAINAPADPDPHSFSAFQALAEQLNGTGSASASASASATATTTEPPAQSWAIATATITDGASTWTSVYTSYDGTPAPTFAPGGPVNHLIQVGIDGLSYTPSNISAAIGDTVTFEFHPKNHTVTQSSFSQPCKSLTETSTTGQVGFKSGFQFVAANETNFPTFNITINDTSPIWMYCGQVGHCAAGMVVSINAVESGPNNFAAFQAIANATGNASTSSSGTSSAPASSQTHGAAMANKPLGYTLLLGAIGAVAALL
ncbi:Cupredoxin [Mycena sanguinolenta]|nr:Cupredoxin [Mycena sanguinolenta]